LDVFEPISENPMLSFDVAEQNQFYLAGRDNNGNKIQAEVSP
jgi:sulfur-oxidizing protein SoxY